MPIWSIDIRHDGVLLATVTGRTPELAHWNARSKMLRLQLKSIDYALQHEGYSFSKPYLEGQPSCPVMHNVVQFPIPLRAYQKSRA